jgi:CBS domain-containing protein
MTMRVSDVMTPDVQLCTPQDTVKDAAEAMAELDVGLLPVAEQDHLVGMISDRDIAIRAVAKGRGPDTVIGEVMTPDVKYCFEDQDLESVSWNMGDIQVRRLPVLNREKRLVGIISLADIARSRAGDTTAGSLHQISRPGGQHTQGRGFA